MRQLWTGVEPRPATESVRFAPGATPRLHATWGTKKCSDCPSEVKRRGKRGPLPKRCEGCARKKKQAEWRGVKKRRADRYGTHGKVGKVERTPLSRGRATKWRYDAFMRGVTNVAHIKTLKELHDAEGQQNTAG